MSCFDNLSSEELIFLAGALAIFLSQDKSVEELGSLSIFFSALGDNIGIIASKKT